MQIDPWTTHNDLAQQILNPEPGVTIRPLDPEKPITIISTENGIALHNIEITAGEGTEKQGFCFF